LLVYLHKELETFNDCHTHKTLDANSAESNTGIHDECDISGDIKGKTKHKNKATRTTYRAPVEPGTHACGHGTQSRSERLLGHFFLLNDKLPFFVLLRLLKGLLVEPAHRFVARHTEDIADGVKTRGEDAVLLGATRHIDDTPEQIRPTVSALKGLGDELVVEGQVGATVCAPIDDATAQVFLEQLSHGVLTG